MWPSRALKCAIEASRKELAELDDANDITTNISVEIRQQLRDKKTQIEERIHLFQEALDVVTKVQSTTTTNYCYLHAHLYALYSSI